jgi:hypothetical protein
VRNLAGAISFGVACGDADSVIWLDPQTLLVAHYAGALPTAAHCSGPVGAVPL